ncbi:MAG: hypothetical protein Q4C47_03685 [Planctomycetia bacterium]|nr:hypothetical protein [Planctomycetia bacterium]
MFTGWRKRDKSSDEFPLLCPECNTVIPVEDWCTDADLAICRVCNTLFRPSGYLVPGGTEALSRNRGLGRVRVLQRGDQVRIVPPSVLQRNFYSLWSLGIILLVGICLGLFSISWIPVVGASLILLLINVIVIVILLSIVLFFGTWRMVLEPGEAGFHTGTYCRFRFFRRVSFPIDADSLVFLTLQPGYAIEETGTLKTLLTVRTNMEDFSFGPEIPEHEKKVLAVYLWRYIRNLKTVKGHVIRRPDTDERLKCPVCHERIPFDNVRPSENLLVCGATAPTGS